MLGGIVISEDEAGAPITSGIWSSDFGDILSVLSTKALAKLVGATDQFVRSFRPFGGLHLWLQ